MQVAALQSMPPAFVQALQRGVLGKDISSQPPSSFPLRCVESVFAYCHGDASVQMQWALEESAHLARTYSWRGRDLDEEYVFRVKTLLKAVEEANRVVSAPEEIWQKLAVTFFPSPRKDKKIFFPQLLDSICAHRSFLCQRIAWNFLENFAEIFDEGGLWGTFIKTQMFTPNGIEKILAARFPTQLFAMAEKRESLFSSLDECLQKVTDGCFVVIYRELGSYHVTPIFFRRTSGVLLDVVITDSLKMEATTSWRGVEFDNELLRGLDRYFNARKIHATLYFFDVQRLYHTDTCAAFTIEDVSYFLYLERQMRLPSRAPGKLTGEQLGLADWEIVTLFYWAWRHSKKTINRDSCLQVYSFSCLPPPMMRCTQSQSVIEAYLQAYPTMADKGLEFDLADHEVVGTYYSEKLGKEVTKAVNNRAAEEAVSYMKELFLSCYPQATTS